jgi:CheY-like chemotaxis protein
MAPSILLIIEDNPLVAQMYQEAFEKAGVETFASHNSENGLNMAKEKKPNIILLDLLMPGTNGYEVLRRLKDDAETRHIPVVVVSIITDEESINKAKELGARDYLVKGDQPIDQLVTRVLSCAESSR